MIGDMESDPATTSGHLRAASDAIMLLVREVEQSERLKRGIIPGDGRFYELAQAVRIAAQALADFAREEEAWARSAPVEDERVPAISQSESPPRLAEILERWRVVERALDSAPPGSPEAQRLFAEFHAIRDEYMAAFKSRDDEV